MPPRERDPVLTGAGAALLFVGVAETVLGFFFFAECTSSFNGVCFSRDNAGLGLGFLVAGIVVLVPGAIIYLLARRSRFA